MMNGPMMGGYGTPWWIIGLMVAFGVLVVVAIVGLVAMLAATNRNRHAQVGAGENDRRLDEASALETLRERYAHGEIDTATFEEQVERLERTRPPESSPTVAQ